MEDDDDPELLFADEQPEPEPSGPQLPPWKIAIVDDDPSVHDITKLALRGFTFNDRALEFLQAYSGADAIDLLRQNPDTALVLLDVVMEEEDSGLKVVHRVREELGFSAVRIVLRTGQPGQAPEHSIIKDYDINDYKEKTELTAKKLFTLVCASLRSFMNLEALMANRRGLRQIVEASTDLYRERSLEGFTEGALRQLTALLHLRNSAYYSVTDSVAIKEDAETYSLLASSGRYASMSDPHKQLDLPGPVRRRIEAALQAGENIYASDHVVAVHQSERGYANVLYASTSARIGSADQELLELFNSNLSAAFENLDLRQEIDDTQKEIVYLLGETVESRSKETGNHVKRVAEMSEHLALLSGMDAGEAEILKRASPMHDLGKIGIPDSILNKPGPLTPEEWEIMKTHAQIGADLLSRFNRPIMQAGAIVAAQHHEKWDGSGYPRGLKGEEIHPFGRITALIDVFDALGSDRCYKPAWPLDQVLDLIRTQSGSHFDPHLVDLLLGDLEEFLAIRERHQDRFCAPAGGSD